MEHIDLEDGTVCLRMTREEAMLLRQFAGRLSHNHRNRWSSNLHKIFKTLRNIYDGYPWSDDDDIIVEQVKFTTSKGK